MRVAITGAAGLFGHGLVEVFKRGHEVFPLTRQDADITDAGQVRAALKRLRPEVVVHAAAIPEPDRCETQPALAYQVNVHGARHVTEAAREVGAVVAHISTDSVFDGKKTSPYAETDATIPLSVYGRTKLRAEKIVAAAPRHWIFRVSVLFGPGKTNTIEKCLRRLTAGEQCVAASDQLSSASYTLDVAETIRQVVEARRYGLYHVTNSGPCTRVELARRAAELAGLDPASVVGLPLDQMGRPAARQKYAVLDMSSLTRAGIAPPRPWQEALAEYVGTLPVPDKKPR